MWVFYKEMICIIVIKDGQKQCSKCKVFRDFEEFYKRKNRSGLFSSCKRCQTRDKQRYDRHKEAKLRNEKICSKCGVSKVFSEFTITNTSKDKLYSSCRRCNSRNKDWYDLNKVLKIQGEKICVICFNILFVVDFSKTGNACKKCQCIRNTVYRENNVEEVAEYHKKYYDNNKIHLTKSRKNWEDKNKKRRKKYHKEYYQKNKKHMNATHIKWMKVNPDKVAEANMRRLILEFNSEGSHTLDEWAALLWYYDYKCLCCSKRGVLLERDHIIPVSKGGSFYIDNMQPLCKSCNVRKSNRFIDYRFEPILK